LFVKKKMKSTENQSVLLFDGVCNLCNASVDFIMRSERDTQLKFASLQSDYGQSVLESQKLDAVPDSLVYYNGKEVFFKSSAAFKITQHLKWPYNWLSVFGVLPTPLRDLIYDWIARNRYRWFGKKETCRLPNAEEQERFLG
jgi:predicted DCC family thiol-disulfide oxidoreductase YuxK